MPQFFNYKQKALEYYYFQSLYFGFVWLVSRPILFRKRGLFIGESPCVSAVKFLESREEFQRNLGFMKIGLVRNSFEDSQVSSNIRSNLLANDLLLNLDSSGCQSV